MSKKWGEGNLISSTQPKNPRLVLDNLLVSSVYTNAAHEAERNLTDDKWDTSRTPYNQTRELRMSDLAVRFLEEIKPSIRQMTVKDLVESLKTMPIHSLSSDYEGVDYYVVIYGNKMLLEELKKRPSKEVESLKRMKFDDVEVILGERSFNGTLKEIIEYDVLKILHQ